MAQSPVWYRRHIPAGTILRAGGTISDQSRHKAAEPRRTSHTGLHKKLSMCYTSLYFLLSSAGSCLRLPPSHHPILSTSTMSFMLLLLPTHISFHLRHWSIACLEESSVSSSSPADVWQLPACWHVSYSPRPLRFTSCVTVSTSSSATSASSCICRRET